MRHLTIASLLFVCALVMQAEALFLGPIAIGVGVGALAAKKGFILGAIIAGRRSRGHRSSSYSSSRSYHQSHHYDTTYTSHYTKPTTYYYSSSQYTYRRGKRSADQYSQQEMLRIKRAVESFDLDQWMIDMSSKDQDDCSKKLICDLSAKAAFNLNSLSRDEKTLVDMFNKALDINSSEVEFELAAAIGKNKGEKRCKQLYKRCETSTEDMLLMIDREMQELRNIELEVKGLSEGEIKEQIEKENAEVQKNLKEAGIDSAKIWD